MKKPKSYKTIVSIFLFLSILLPYTTAFATDAIYVWNNNSEETAETTAVVEEKTGNFLNLESASRNTNRTKYRKNTI